MSAAILLKRDTGWVDHVRDYRVLLNGREVGRIADGETRRIDIPAGRHALWLRVDWCRSNRAPLEIKEGDLIRLACGSNLRGIRIALILLYVTIGWSKYLWLKRVSV